MRNSIPSPYSLAHTPFHTHIHADITIRRVKSIFSSFYIFLKNLPPRLQLSSNVSFASLCKFHFCFFTYSVHSFCSPCAPIFFTQAFQFLFRPFSSTTHCVHTMAVRGGRLKDWGSISFSFSGTRSKAFDCIISEMY